MNDFKDSNYNEEEELDAILNEIKGMETHGEPEQAPESTEEVPSKEWSVDDIDRLISGETDLDYPDDSVPVRSMSDIDAILSEEYNSEIFSIQPITEAKPEKEMQDITSDAGEVDGQETFYGDEPEEIDFELETFVIPEDKPEEAEIKYDRKPAHTEPLPPSIVPEEPELDLEDLFSGIEDLPAEILEAPADESSESANGYTEESLWDDAAFEENKDEAAVSEPEPEPEPEPERESDIPADETADYRTRFFTKLRLEYTKEEEIYRGPVDKSGYVVSKTEDPVENDLESVPTIKAAEDVKQSDDEKTKIVKESTREASLAPASDTVEGQIVLNGFVDMPEEAIPTHSREDDIEENLWKRRKAKASNFKLDGIDDDGFDKEFDKIESEEEKYEAEKAQESEEKAAEKPEAAPSAPEYSDPNERNAFYNKLSDDVAKSKKTLIITGIIAAVMFLIEILPPFAERFSIETSLFVRNSMVLCVVKAILLIAAVGLDSERFVDSLSGIKKGKFTCGSAVSISLAVALIENTLSAIFGAEAAVFSTAAVASDLILKFTDFIDAKRIFENFSVCAFTYEHNMYAVHRFENDSEIFELGRGLLMGNAEMLYSSNVDFPSNFMENSKKEPEVGKNVKLSLICSGIISVIALAVSAVVRGEFMAGLAVGTGCFCISAPVTASFIPSFILRSANRRLNREGTMISSLASAVKTASANAAVIDSADIFDRDKCTMHGMKSFETLRTDAVLLYASAMVIKSGGPLKECFEKVVDGRQDLLPPVRELVYEDKMGISARIYDQKVLLGNRNMLIHHNINAPDKEFENKYLHDGHKVIYLACNEMLAALFVVSYSVDDTMKACLKRLESNGIQILVRTNDVNVTEELISDSFGLSRENFKILSSVAGRLFKRRKDIVSDSLPAEIIHDGKAYSMIKAIATACSMATGAKITGILRMVLSLLAAVIGILAGCTAAFGLTGSIAVLLLIAQVLIIAGIIELFDKK